MKDLWPILLPVLLGGSAVFLLLPRPNAAPRLLGAALAALALALAGALWLRTGTIGVESLLFYAFSALAVSAGVVMITQSNPARAALAFAVVVLASCGLFLLQAAPFLMAATIIIYAGAIIVTFLFVLMLAQQEGPSDADQRSREPQLATAAGAVLLLALLYVLFRNYDTGDLDAVLARVERAQQQKDPAAMAQALKDETFVDDLIKALQKAPGGRQFPAQADRAMELNDDWVEAKRRNDAAALKKVLEEFWELGGTARGYWGDLPPDPRLPRSNGSQASLQPALHDARGRAPLPAENTAALGRSLFSDYLLAVELAGMLLTVATIGAIVIAARRGGSDASRKRGAD
jgi:NADH:ubiquinone oxidoreductase subunit 6 (subunit J)